jgi:type IV secretory pathway VirB2 component (pilin)
VAWASAWWLRLIFGTTLSWHNAICYVLGVAVAALADAVVTHREARR